MRVEITFAGDSHDAVISSEELTKAIRRLFVQAEETAHAVQEIKVTARQTAESVANLQRQKAEVRDLGREARQTTRELALMRTAGLGGTAYGLRNVRTVGLASLIGLGAATSGPAGGALAAGGLAAAGLGGVGIAGIGTLVAAFHGLGKAIEGDRQEFEKLDPAAQKFVQTLRSLAPWVDKLQGSLREGLFPGLEQGLRSALTPANASAFEDGLRGIAEALGDVGQQWGESIGSPGFTAGFRELMQHGAVWTRELGDAADHLATALGHVVIAGLPLTDWLVESIDNGARLVDEWIRAKDASGELATGIAGAKDELEIVAHFIGAVVDAAFELSAALLPLGNEILRDLTATLEDVATWVSANRDEISDFTLGALHALEDVLNAVIPLTLGLAHGLSEISDAVGGWENAFKIVIGGVLANAVIGLTGKFALLAGPEGIGGAAIAAARLFTLLKATSLLSFHNVGSDLRKALEEQVPELMADGKFGLKATPTGDTGFRSADLNPRSTGNTKNLAEGRRKLIEFAKSAIGKPYLWGGAGPNSFDCSGLVMWAFAQEGISIPHFSGSQYNSSTRVSAANAQPGDVVFTRFDGEGVPQHEGLLLPGGQVLVAPHKGSNVQIQSLAGFTQGRVEYGSFFGAGGAPLVPTSKNDPFTTPKAWSGTGGDLLPQELATSLARADAAMAKAGATPGRADDARAQAQERAALRAAIKWLESHRGAFAKDQQDDVYRELAALYTTLTGLDKQAKKPAMASKAGLISARSQVGSLIALLTGNPAAAATAAGEETVAHADANLDALRKRLGPKILKLAEELTHPMTAKHLAEVRAQLAQWSKLFEDAARRSVSAHERARQAHARILDQQKNDFKDAWQAIAQSALDAFDEETSKHKTPSEILLAQITDEHDMQSLKDALTDAQKQLADALKGHEEDPQGIVARAREYVGKAFLANAVDKAQSAILGGAAVAVSGEQILSDLQKILVANTVVDQDEVARAQKAVDEAQYNIRVHDLGKMADAEREAYDAERAALRKHLEDLAGEWELYFGFLNGNIAAIRDFWIGTLNGMGLSGLASGLGAATASPSEALQDIHEQAVSGAISRDQYLASIIGHKFEIPGFAAGGDFVANKPTFFVAGEGAVPEHVRIVPQRGGGRVGDDVHVTITGNMPPEWFDAQIDRATPRISRNIGVRAIDRLRGGRF